jgi:hypothetical protein
MATLIRYTIDYDFIGPLALGGPDFILNSHNIGSTRPISLILVSKFIF